MAPQSLSLWFHAILLIIIYSSYGYLQEKIMRSSTYGPNDEHFTNSALLVVANRAFSVSVGLAISFYQSRSAPEVRGSFVHSLKPRSPLFAYASVACFNFLSTTCQYEALKYVSFTTQSLAKTSKMIPVLVVGALVWRKKHKTKEWVAGGVILLGCATYLLSQSPRSAHAYVTIDSDHEGFLNGLAGACFLVGYLFFDGLTSTTQEKVFGKNPSPSDPFGPDSPVLDQMVWTNVFAGMIAVAAALASSFTGSLLPSLRLIALSPSLSFDIFIFSAASAVGLIVLLNTIASFGALTSSLIMTVRQFLSILINAGAFGNFGTVSLEGWCGVGWVASGIWIKVNKAYDPPRPTTSRTPGAGAEEEFGLLGEEEKHVQADAGDRASRSRPWKTYARQYLVPVAIPVALSLVIGLLTLPSGVLSSNFMYGSTAASDTVPVQGGQWAKELHQIVRPTCHNTSTVPWAGSTRTALVSFPRSGNSYTRSLVERATGFQTSSIYCDKSLLQTFEGECDLNATFFVKTHFPALPRRYDPTTAADYYRQFDQAVLIIRNPLDSIASWWHLIHARQTNGLEDHEAKVELPGGKFGKGQRRTILDLADRWLRHAKYWSQAPIRTHTLRYEDLRATPVPEMMSLLTFVLGADTLPSLEKIACMVEANSEHEAYHSRRLSDFSSWENWTPELRAEVLDVTRRPFCAAGYLPVLAHARGGLPAEMEGFCDKTSWSWGSEGAIQAVAVDNMPVEDAM